MTLGILKVKLVREVRTGLYRVRKNQFNGAVEFSLNVQDGETLGVKELAEGQVLKGTVVEESVLCWNKGGALEDGLG